MNFKVKTCIYMDYSACAPELEVSVRARKYADKFFGNPSSIHKEGVKAKNILTDARKICANALSAHEDEIIFTGSGTESDNIAIFGVFKNLKLKDPSRKLHIVTTKIEHSAVLEVCKHLEEVGVAVTYLPVSSEGLIDIKDLREALTPETFLVSIAYANSEIGVVQPIKEIAKEIRHFKKNNDLVFPLFHTDACQAGAYLDINVEKLGVDLLTLNGTKIGGPRGTGLLYIKRGIEIDSMFYGGGQEKGIRAGTENVSGVYGFAKALEYSRKKSEEENTRLESLRNYFFDELTRRFTSCRLNGNREIRLPNNINVSFPGFDSELLVLELDAKGICVSAGSACGSEEEKSSHVISALYDNNDSKKYGTIRFSLGKTTAKRDVNFALNSLDMILGKYKNLN